jgi:hypothetical protein
LEFTHFLSLHGEFFPVDCPEEFGQILQIIHKLN